MRAASAGSSVITNPPRRRRRPTSRRRRKSRRPRTRRRRSRRRTPAAASANAHRKEHDVAASPPGDPRQHEHDEQKDQEWRERVEQRRVALGARVGRLRLPFRRIGGERGDDVVDAARHAAVEIAGLEPRRDGVGDDDRSTRRRSACPRGRSRPRSAPAARSARRGDRTPLFFLASPSFQARKSSLA